VRGTRSDAPSDHAVLLALACALVVCASAWLWAGVAGVLFGRGWPPASLWDDARALARLPSRPADPAAAWPPPARSRLPGPVPFYATLALLAAGGGAGLLLARRLPRVSPLTSRAGARWAFGHELRPLRGPMRKQGRLALGRRAGRLLYAEQRHALVAFGPPQSGKSAGLAVPALLEWDGPAIASSIKTDLLSATLACRRAKGAVYVFDPFGLSGVASHTWSPLHAAHTWDGALEVAWRLAACAELDSRGVEGGDFWAVAAEQRLAPLLFVAARAGGGIDALVRWTYGQGARELDQTLAQITGEAHDEAELADAYAAYDAVRAFETQADRTRSSIEATAQALLRAYRFSRVARSAASSEISAQRVLDESATLYLIGDAKASKLLRPIFLALLSEIVDMAYQRATRSGGRLERPLLLCLDEAGNVAPLPNLAEIASTAPSHNIQLVSIFHDLAQARSRYGQQAQTVVNSHRARMLLPGVADLETLRYFASLVGEEEAQEITRTVGADGTTRSSARRRRPLIAPEALRQLPPGHALLIYGQLPPVRLRLRLWFEDRRLLRLARGAAAAADGRRAPAR
jgi:type IV secretion system protein VirD4